MDSQPSSTRRVITTPTSDVSDGLELAIIIPTFNERDNIRPLLDRLTESLAGLHWEVVFVDDDSPDGTADCVREIARHRSNVRVIQRIGRRGLASACVEGVLSTSTPYFAVMDADLQHNEVIIPEMLKMLKENRLDIVVGSRFADGGSVGKWNKRRQYISQIASRAARLLVKADLKDPMSGFFVMQRQSFDPTVRNLSQQGFKILLDLFASAPKPLRFAELPYEFRLRTYGESKLDAMAGWEYGMLLADKLFGRFIPPRLVLFGLVGALGVLVHMVALATALMAGLIFALSQTIAVITAMTFNFMLNNVLTYRDRRLRGWDAIRGLLSFYFVCSLGAVANVGIAALFYNEAIVWWLAGFAGAVVGSVWNYAASAFLTWRRV
jgi:dolichol-phosphate mannosyltransferase